MAGFSWRAILSGAAVSLAFLTLFLLFGAALGLSIIDPYEITRHENSAGWSIATIAWVSISSLASFFLGSWVAGHLAAHFGGASRESVLMDGAVVWAICTVLIAFTPASLVLGRNRFVGADTAEGKALANYSSLNDPQFAGFLLEHARNWKPGSPETPQNVSVDENRVKPSKVADNTELQRFVEHNTNLNKSQTKEFFTQDKNAIAAAQADAQRRWEDKHAAELAIADQHRRTAAEAAWTLTGIAFFGLMFSLGGAYVGWYQREHNDPFAPKHAHDVNPRTEPFPANAPRM